MKQILQQIGLTNSEIEVYVTLNKLGSARAGDIIRKSGLQSPVAHRAFHSLAEKGLITSIVIGKIREYQSAEPEQLLSILAEKREQLLSILPQLKTQREQAEVLPKARVFRGVKAVRELLNYMIANKPKELLAYGGAKRSNEVLKDFFWKGFHKKRLQAKISVRMVFHQSLAKRAAELNALPRTKVRITKMDFEELVETIVVDNKIAIIIYLDDPYGFLLEEKRAAQSYRMFFESIWHSAEN